MPCKAMSQGFQNLVWCCQCGQYLLCNISPHFWVLMQQERKSEFHYFSTQFWSNLGVLFFPWKLLFIPSRTMFQYANVASIGSAMSFRVFHVSLSRGWGSVSLFQHPILVQSWCSFFLLKATFYTFQTHVSICKCGQYWSCNFISSFWCFLQQGMGECIIISAPNSGSILVFFFSSERYLLYLLWLCFNIKMWPVLVLQFHFEFLMFPLAWGSVSCDLWHRSSSRFCKSAARCTS